jgi:hypothetical protein
MTVVRRELPLSRSASRLRRGPKRRIAQARALQSCPHRRAVDPLQETHMVVPPSQAAARVGAWVMAAHTKPANSRATAATATVGRLP